jgi:hypothetical protein
VQWYTVPPSDGITDEQSEPHRSHRRAMERGDEVVQQLAVAKYALSIGDQARTMAAIDAALDIARHSLSKLLDVVCPPESLTRAGALVRPAGGGTAERPPPPTPRLPSD